MCCGESHRALEVDAGEVAGLDEVGQRGHLRGELLGMGADETGAHGGGAVGAACRRRSTAAMQEATFSNPSHVVIWRR